MAKIVGNLAPEDDYPHALGPEPNFNESDYFNFFDRKQQARRLVPARQPRQRRPRREDGLPVSARRPRALLFGRPQIANNDAFDAGGLRFDVIEPTQRLRTRFEGTLLELAEPRAMADPQAAFDGNPQQAGRARPGARGGGADVRQQADKKADEDAEQSSRKAHYEQHMHVTGTLSIEGERFAIDGFGLRDHSWGPRYWQAIHSYEWLTLNFGPDFGAMVSVIQRDAAGEERRPAACSCAATRSTAGRGPHRGRVRGQRPLPPAGHRARQDGEGRGAHITAT